MIKIENVDIFGWESAIRGMRNPMSSWSRSDSGTCLGTLPCHSCEEDRKTCAKNTYNHTFIVGPNDRDLMLRLCKAGPEHAKFMRMIVVCLDITAPLYWWKEFDTYKVGTVANSCSTMHKIAAKDFTLEDFSYEHMNAWSLDILTKTIERLNRFRKMYICGGYTYDENDQYVEFKPKDKYIWWQMIQLLPSSYNQKRTIMLNYEVLANIYRQRKGHKLDEWNNFCAWIETLPYSELITGEQNNDI